MSETAAQVLYEQTVENEFQIVHKRASTVVVVMKVLGDDASEGCSIASIKNSDKMSASFVGPAGPLGETGLELIVRKVLFAVCRVNVSVTFFFFEDPDLAHALEALDAMLVYAQLAPKGQIVMCEGEHRQVIVCGDVIYEEKKAF